MVLSPQVKLYQPGHLGLSAEEIDTIPEIKSHSFTDTWTENGGIIQFADIALPYRDTGVISPLIFYWARQQGSKKFQFLWRP